MEKATAEQMRNIDRKTIEEYGVTEKRLMENAGLRIAEFLREKFPEKNFTFYTGKGNNGGDAMVAARRLNNWNREVEVVLAYEGLEGLGREELEILENLGVDVNLKEAEKDYEVAVDGLLGYGVKGDPRPPLDKMIQDINSHEEVVSIDIASGLDPDTGERGEPCVKPDFTVTLAAPFKEMDKKNSGDILVADIGVPPEVYREFDIPEGLFSDRALRRFRP